MKNLIKVSILAMFLSFSAATTFAQVSIGVAFNVGTPPPPLPVYEQPPCPVDGYLWTPGYWAYDDADGYYWVPGAWVAPPQPNYLWTPGYWGWQGGFYGFHHGYWGPHVGYYGGINYGCGYIGVGFVGGGWFGGHFRYNTAVMRVNTTVIHNTYVNRTVINNVTVNRTSFNGPNGVRSQPRPEERAAMNEHHINPTSQQMSHQTMASHDHSQFASVNHGAPATAAVARVSNRPFSQQQRTSAGNAPHSATGFGNHTTGAAPGGQPQHSGGFGQQHQNAQPNHTQMSGPPQQHQQAPQQHQQAPQQHQQAPQQHQQAPQQQQPRPQPQQQRQPPQQQHGGFGQPRGGGGGRPAGGGGGHRHG